MSIFGAEIEDPIPSIFGAGTARMTSSDVPTVTLGEVLVDKILSNLGAARPDKASVTYKSGGKSAQSALRLF